MQGFLGFIAALLYNGHQSRCGQRISREEPLKIFIRHGNPWARVLYPREADPVERCDLPGDYIESFTSLGGSRTARSGTLKTPYSILSYPMNTGSVNALFAVFLSKLIY